jgi:hypothetical protein
MFIRSCYPRIEFMVPSLKPSSHKYIYAQYVVRLCSVWDCINMKNTDMQIEIGLVSLGQNDTFDDNTGHGV